jgi:hypothetical protein
MTPYEKPVDRVRALYRLPTAPDPQRTLELCCDRRPVVVAGRAAEEDRVCCVIGAADAATWDETAVHWLPQSGPITSLPLASRSFDLVVLHRTLDDLEARVQDSPRFDARGFLSNVVEMLVPGGLIAGCVQNTGSFRSIARRWAQALHLRGRGDGQGHYSLNQLRGMLEEAGLSNVRTFSLLPNADAPLRLIDTDAKVAELVFRQDLDAARASMSMLSFLVKRASLTLGLHRRFQADCIFFWACKPC